MESAEITSRLDTLCEQAIALQRNVCALRDEFRQQRFSAEVDKLKVWGKSK